MSQCGTFVNTRKNRSSKSRRYHDCIYQKYTNEVKYERRDYTVDDTITTIESSRVYNKLMCTMHLMQLNCCDHLLKMNIAVLYGFYTPRTADEFCLPLT